LGALVTAYYLTARQKLISEEKERGRRDER